MNAFNNTTNNYFKNNYRQTINCHLRLSDIIFLYTICQPLMTLIMTPTTCRTQHSTRPCKIISHEWRKFTTDNLWQQPQKQKHKQQTAKISTNDATTAMECGSPRNQKPYYDEIDKNPPTMLATQTCQPKCVADSCEDCSGVIRTYNRLNEHHFGEGHTRTTNTNAAVAKVSQKAIALATLYTGLSYARSWVLLLLATRWQRVKHAKPLTKLLN